ncbi:MAG: bifunctional serine/threonine-protein kinase/formylglycine-generating enzyme family protein [Elainellaceae cyanobacterium]
MDGGLCLWLNVIQELGEWPVRLVGRYDIVKQLAEGGFGVTFVGRDIMQPSQPLCVIKQLQPHQASEPRIRQFFNDEAIVLERLGKHPQIPQLLAYFTEAQHYYIVQEYIDGQDLSCEIETGKKLSESYVRRMLEECLHILTFVHQQKIIHRDIKPANVMRRRSDGKLMLIDFGAVKQIKSLVVNNNGVATSTVAIYTSGYAPPEQLLGKPCLSSDLYALGMTAIYALSGLSPEQFSEDPATGEKLWQHEVRASDELKAFLYSLVRRHYSYRYPSAVEALDAFQDLYSSTSTTAPPASRRSSSPPPPRAASTPPPRPAPSYSPTTPLGARQARRAAPSASPQYSPSPPKRPKPQPVPSPSPQAPAFKSRRWVLLSLAMVGLGTTLATRQRLGELPPAEPEGEPDLTPDNGAEPKAEPDPEPDPEPESEPEPAPTGPGGIPLETTTLSKETVKLNAQGTIVESRPVQVTMFQEDLSNGVILKMVEIPAGEFDRGSPSDELDRDDDEGPVLRVSVPRFYMGMFEVTQAQYQAVMGGNNPTVQYDTEPVQPDKPVAGVSWQDAAEFCRKLSDSTGRSYRLPSETEWEYACRAEKRTPFYFGETLSTDIANYDGDYAYGSGQTGENRSATMAVGSFPPNGFGLFDMHGNVWEWCQDHYMSQYDDSSNSRPRRSDIAGVQTFVIRGGAWNTPPTSCRSAARDRLLMGNLLFNPLSLGFRLVCRAI